MQTFLVMDDEQSCLDFIEGFLQVVFGSRAVIRLARNPVEAAQALKEIDLSTLGCIISDVQQPTFENWAFIDQVLAEGRVPKGKILAISGGPYHEQANQRGVAFLPKPMKFQEFMVAVKLACVWPNDPE
jgi:CheY-like chemotaxis protein